MARRLGVDGRPGAGGGLHRHQGARGRAAAVAAPARPDARHRAVPGGQLPDLRDGRHARRLPGRAGARRRRVAARSRRDRRGRRRPGARACGSTRRATRPARSTTSARPRPGAGHAGVPVLSDECYVEFTWDGPPHTILEHGTDGVLAVHSLSKRVEPRRRPGRLLRRRRRARARTCPRSASTPGSWCPGPVQAAAVAALERRRPRRRAARALPRAAERLRRDPRAAARASTRPLPDGGFYLWVAGAGRRRLGPRPAPRRRGRASLASPGEFYGDGRSRPSCGSRSSSRSTASSSWPSGWRPLVPPPHRGECPRDDVSTTADAVPSDGRLLDRRRLDGARRDRRASP